MDVSAYCYFGCDPVTAHVEKTTRPAVDHALPGPFTNLEPRSRQHRMPGTWGWHAVHDKEPRLVHDGKPIGKGLRPSRVSDQSRK